MLCSVRCGCYVPVRRGVADAADAAAAGPAAGGGSTAWAAARRRRREAPSASLLLRVRRAPSAIGGRGSRRPARWGDGADRALQCVLHSNRVLRVPAGASGPAPDPAAAVADAPEGLGGGGGGAVPLRRTVRIWISSVTRQES